MDKVIRASKLDDEEQQESPASEIRKVAPPVFIGKAPPTGEPYRLQYPMKWDGKEYKEVPFNRLKGGDFSQMQSLTVVFGGDIALLHLITKIPVEVLQMMDADDYTEVLERCDPFIPASIKKLGEQMSELLSTPGQNSPGS